MAKQLRKLPECLQNIDRRLKAIILLIVILISFTGVAKAEELLYAEVKVYDESGKTSKTGEAVLYDTAADTVGEFLKEEQITIGELDKINYSLDTPIEKNMEIKIDRAFYVNIAINGDEPFPYLTNDSTVWQVIVKLGKERSCEFVVSEGENSLAKLRPDMAINLVSVKEEEHQKTEDIPFETNTVENPNLYEGTQNVISEGQNGSKSVTVKETYVSGKLEKSENIKEEIIKEPVTKVIEIGTKAKPVTITTEKGTFEVAKELYVKTTAYTASTACTGKGPGDRGFGITASGMRAAVGVVAVDPSVIPLGTKLYIEGYGYAVAGDTGSAIKNNKIDLYFNTDAECRRYGVRNTKVYVLGQPIK